MKVVVLSQALAPQFGGASVSEASLCSSLQKHCTTVVLCRKGRLDAEFARGFGLTDVKEVGPKDALGLWRDSSHWLRRCLSDADVLHVNGHWRWDHLLIAHWCHRRGIPYLLHPRGMFWVGHRKIWLKRIFNRVLGFRVVRNASKLIALSEFETTEWNPYGETKAKTKVIPNGVSGIPTGGVKSPWPGSYFLYLGRIEKRKNLVFLVEAFHRYAKDGGQADLVMLGPVERGYDRQVENAARRAGLGSRVRVQGAVYGQAKSDFLKHALGVIYPAIQEPFGRVPFETLAAGGVPIVPWESGAAEYLRAFLPGLLFPLGDRDALVACMRSAERIDRQEDAGLDRARAWVAKQLDWTPITEQVLSVYRELNMTRSNEILSVHESPLSKLSELGGMERQSSSTVL